MIGDAVFKGRCRKAWESVTSELTPEESEKLATQILQGRACPVEGMASANA